VNSINWNIIHFYQHNTWSCYFKVENDKLYLLSIALIGDQICYINTNIIIMFKFTDLYNLRNSYLEII